MSSAHLALSSEAATALAGARIEREQSRIDGAGEDAHGAGTAGARCGRRRIDRRVGPRRDAATVVSIRGAAIGRDARVVTPEFAAAPRIERNDFVERRAEDQLVGDEDRRRLELDALHQRGIAARLVAGAIDPSTAQVGNVVWRDLAGSAVTAAALVGAVERPAGGGGVRRVKLAADQQRCDGTTKSPQAMAPDAHGLLILEPRALRPVDGGTLKAHTPNA